MIEVSTPASLRSPFVGHEFDLLSASRGVQPISRKLAIVGCRLSSGIVAAATPTQIFSEADGARKFGAGSDIDLMARVVMAVGRALGAQADVYGVGIDASGTAATATFTITGTATKSGDLVVWINGYEVRAPVNVGDLQNAIATSLKTAIDAIAAYLPCTAGVATNVVTLTARHAGVNGNQIPIASITDDPAYPTGVTNTLSGAKLGSVVAGVGAVDITAALDALATDKYQVIALVQGTATDIADNAASLTSCWAALAKRWRHVVMGSTDTTLSNVTTLATTANDYRQLIGWAPGGHFMPGQLAAFDAAIILSTENPAYNFDDTEVAGVLRPMSKTDNPIPTVGETALAAGVIPHYRNDNGTGLRLSSMVTTSTTVSGVNVESTRKYKNSATPARIAEDVDAELTLAKRGQNITDKFLRRCFQIVKGILEQRERDGWLHNVAAHMPELLVERDKSSSRRIKVKIPESVPPDADQIINLHTLYVE